MSLASRWHGKGFFAIISQLNRSYYKIIFFSEFVRLKCGRRYPTLNDFYSNYAFSKHYKPVENLKKLSEYRVWTF